MQGEREGGGYGRNLPIQTEGYGLESQKSAIKFRETIHNQRNVLYFIHMKTGNLLLHAVDICIQNSGWYFGAPKRIETSTRSRDNMHYYSSYTNVSSSRKCRQVVATVALSSRINIIQLLTAVKRRVSTSVRMPGRFNCHTDGAAIIIITQLKIA